MLMNLRRNKHTAYPPFLGGSVIEHNEILMICKYTSWSNFCTKWASTPVTRIRDRPGYDGITELLWAYLEKLPTFSHICSSILIPAKTTEQVVEAVSAAAVAAGTSHWASLLLFWAGQWRQFHGHWLGRTTLFQRPFRRFHYQWEMEPGLRCCRF